MTENTADLAWLDVATEGVWARRNPLNWSEFRSQWKFSEICKWVAKWKMSYTYCSHGLNMLKKKSGKEKPTRFHQTNKYNRRHVLWLAAAGKSDTYFVTVSRYFWVIWEMFFETLKFVLTHQYLLNFSDVLGTALKKSKALLWLSISLQLRMREKANAY